MKILLITSSGKSNGGITTYSRKLIEFLSNLENINVEVFYTSPYFNVLNFTSTLFNIRKISKDVDIIHALDAWPYGIYGWLATIGTSKKLFINALGTYSVAPLHSFFKSFLLKRAYFSAVKVFCISLYTQKRIKEIIPNLNNLGVVYLGTTKLGKVQPDYLKKVKQKYNIGENKPVFITVGDIKHRKGQLDTLKTLNLLKNKYRDFLYIIIGKGDYDYQNKIKIFADKENLGKNLLVLNNIKSSKDLSAFYQLSDLFIMNSNNYGNYKEHFEGFGLVFLEAASFGLPVIGSRECGIEDALLDGYNGYLTNQGDHEDIQKAIERIFSSDRAKLSNHSIEFSSRFSWLKTVNKYEEAYVLSNSQK